MKAVTIVMLMLILIVPCAVAQERFWEAYPNEGLEHPIVGFAMMASTDQVEDLGDMVELSLRCATPKYVIINPQGPYRPGSVRDMWVLSHDREESLAGNTYQVTQNWTLALRIGVDVLTKRFLTIWFLTDFGFRSVTFDITGLSELEKECRD